jgi:SNF2 family DNA or RNA helicase
VTTIVLLDVDSQDHTRVTIDCSDTEIELVKQIPGFRYRNSKVTAPKSWATWVTAKAILQDQFESGEAFYNYIRDDYYGRVNPSLGLRELLVPEGVVPTDTRLRPHQVVGARWLAHNRCALLSDDMGLGKTATTISAIKQSEDPFPILVICPNSVKHQWATEFEMWWPELYVSVVDGTATERRKALQPGFDAYIINWDALLLHSNLKGFGGLRLNKCGEHRGGDPDLKQTRCESCKKELNALGFKLIVADEAHSMKDPTSKRTRAAWALMHEPQVEYRFGLTGTPIANSPADLWSIMHGLVPEEYPTKSSFEDRFCHKVFSFWSGYYEVVGLRPDTKEEFFKIFDPRYRRMPKELVLKDLPPIIHTKREAPMSPKQKKAYKELEEHMFTLDENGNLILATNDLVEKTRLLQYASATCEVDEDGIVQLVKPSPKINVMMEVFDETAGQIAVAAESRKLIELASARLEEDGIKHGLIVGDMTQDQRTRVMRDLTDGVIRAILFTMQAGGTGLNMTPCNTLIRLQRSWSMLLNQQTLGRVLRIGSEQHDSINVVDIIAPGTVEVDQYKTVLKKESRLEEITRDLKALESVA